MKDSTIRVVAAVVMYLIFCWKTYEHFGHRVAEIAVFGMSAIILFMSALTTLAREKEAENKKLKDE